MISLLLVLALCRLSGEVVATGPHFEIHLPAGDQRMAERALEGVEAVWPHAVRILGGRSVSAPLPLAIHLYDSVSAYESVEHELTGGKFRRHWAFSHTGSRTSHVVIQPPLGPEAQAAIGLPVATLRLVIHEAFHLAWYALATDADNLWIEEGAADVVAQQVLEDLSLSPGVEGDPWTGTWIDRVQKLAVRPPVEAIVLGDATVTGLPAAARYGLYFLWYRFLAAHPNRSRLARVHSAAARGRPAAEVLDAVRRAFGPLSALEREFGKDLADLQPRWNENRRHLHVGADAWTQLAFPDSPAEAFLREPVGTSHFDVSGTLEILSAPGDRLELYLADHEGGRVRISFQAGEGVDVFAFRGDGSRGEDNVASAHAPFPCGEPIDFRVEVRGQAVRVMLGGVALDCAVPDVDFRQHLGVSAQQGAAGRWVNFQLLRHGAR